MKYILNEKFILNEADNNNNNNNEIFNKQKINDVFNEIQQEASAINIKQYNNFIEFFKLIINNIQTILASPAEINGFTGTFEQAAPNITKNLNEITSTINSISTSIHQKLDILAPNQITFKIDKIEKLKNKANEQSINSLTELETIKNDIINIKNKIDTLTLPKLQLLDKNNIAQQLNKESSNTLNKKIKTDIASLTTFLSSISTTINDLINLNETLNKNIDQLKTLKNTAIKNNKSWDDKYHDVFLQKNDQEALDNFWTEYYATEWKPYTDIVKNLGYALKQELTKLGFSEKVNPFVSFLKQNLDSIGTNLNTNNYAAIHNAYIKNYINADILRQKNKAVDGLSLIFNPKLYQKAPSEILEYLYLQHELFRRQSNKEIDNYLIKDNIIYQAYSTTKNFNQLMAVLFMDTPAELELGDHVQDPIQTIQTANLRSIATIKELWVTCFGEAAAKQQLTWSQSIGKDIVISFNNDANKITQAIKYLITAHEGNFEWLNRYEETAKAGTNFDISLTKSFATKFASYDITEQNVEKVITDIADAANFKKVKK